MQLKILDNILIFQQILNNHNWNELYFILLIYQQIQLQLNIIIIQMQHQLLSKSFPTRKLRFQLKQLPQKQNNTQTKSQIFNLKITQDSDKNLSQISSQGASIKLPQIINYKRSKLKKSDQSVKDQKNQNSIALSKQNSSQLNFSGQFSSQNIYQINVPKFTKAKQIFSLQKYETPTDQGNDEPVIEIPAQIQYPNIHLVIEPLYEKGYLMENQSQSLPACITIKIDETQSKNNLSIDLIFIIDIGESIKGDQLAKFRTALMNLIDQMKPKDRLCLIELDKRITPFKFMTKDNKFQIKKIITQLQIGENNQIAQGLESAILQISERNHQNDVTSIFVISDSKDDQMYHDLLKQKLTNTSITIHSFGIGNSHNPQPLMHLSNLKDGNFYFVSNFDLLSYFLTDALGLVASTIATDFQIKLYCQDNQQLQQLSIRKVHGNQWKMIQQDHIYEINLQQMSSGTKKDFMFEVFIPKSLLKVQEPKQFQISKAILKYKYIGTNKYIEKQQNLSLTFVNDPQQLEDNKRNLKVALQFVRVQLSELILKSLILCKQNQNEQAIELLSMQFNKLLIQFDKNHIQSILVELEETIKACQIQYYKHYGLQLISSIQYNSSNQRGVINKFIDGHQMIDKPIQQNQIQQILLNELLQKG
ncbi:hypothetical protein pb186bvf_003537 [Paramecium bursaria]